MIKSIHKAFADCQKDGRCRNKRKWSHFSLNNKPKFKKKEKVHTQIKEPTILLLVRKACHIKSNKAIAQQCRKKTC